ncbi:MAG: Hsp20 family protein [Pseudomonadota bacterium]
MRTMDFAPLYRSTVGFDRLVSMLDAIHGPEGQSGFPPYNIERTDENAYRISMAVAGFAEADLDIQVKEGTLTIRGEKAAEDKADERQFLHRGIAERSFERRFQLADHVEVDTAALENGLLHVDLKRNLPEAMKPRSIAITTANDHRTLTADAA